jgi:hypothetical protein
MKGRRRDQAAAHAVGLPHRQAQRDQGRRPR